MQTEQMKEAKNGKGAKAASDATNSGAPKATIISIPRANIQTLPLLIEGTTPYVQHKFSTKAREQIEATQMAGSTSTSKGKKRAPKDFDSNYHEAMHMTKDGRHGIPAPSFRNACVSACRLVGFKMTHAKLAIFVHADAYDAEGNPLVVITKGKPHKHMAHARNDNGSIDVRARPMWDPGWQARVMIEFDADIFTPTDIVNLFDRVGKQVGIGEGRHDSRESSGMGWGCFRIVEGMNPKA